MTKMIRFVHPDGSVTMPLPDKMVKDLEARGLRVHEDDIAILHADEIALKEFAKEELGKIRSENMRRAKNSKPKDEPVGEEIQAPAEDSKED